MAASPPRVAAARDLMAGHKPASTLVNNIMRDETPSAVASHDAEAAKFLASKSDELKVRYCRPQSTLRGCDNLLDPPVTLLSTKRSLPR